MGRVAAAVAACGVLVVGLAAAAPASAHNPNNCLTNGIDLTPSKDRQIVRQGETITFSVWAENTKGSGIFPACHITNGAVGLHLPKRDGNYDPNSPTVPVAGNRDFLSGFPYQLLGIYSWTVDLDPRVEYAYTLARASGTLHDTPPDRTFADIVKTVGVQVTNPTLTIDKTGSIQSGQAPQNVTYTYKVTNTSQTPVPMADVAVTDDLCANPTRAAGDPDQGNDGLLSNGEVWTFTCATLHQNAGTYTNTAKACAISRVDNRPVCSPPDTWTVTLTPPPGNPPATPVSNPPTPQSAVLPANATQAPCDIASPTGLTVRAGELTTVRVRVRNVDAGSEARITLPGGKVLRAKTNASGTATFRVRPTRSGRATIRIAECADVARFSVRPARQVQSRRVPRVTG